MRVTHHHPPVVQYAPPVTDALPPTETVRTMPPIVGNGVINCRGLTNVMILPLVTGGASTMGWIRTIGWASMNGLFIPVNLGVVRVRHNGIFGVVGQVPNNTQAGSDSQNITNMGIPTGPGSSLTVSDSVGTCTGTIRFDLQMFQFLQFDPYIATCTSVACLFYLW